MPKVTVFTTLPFSALDQSDPFRIFRKPSQTLAAKPFAELTVKFVIMTCVVLKIKSQRVTDR